MRIEAQKVPFETIRSWRDFYRHELRCQIIHDSLHVRPGWTESFQIHSAGRILGYGALAIAGPWTGKPTLFEFYLLPEFRQFSFASFEALCQASGAVAIETQSNDEFLTVMLHAYAHEVVTESILFRDQTTTQLEVPGTVLRRANTDLAAAAANQRNCAGEWLLDYEGTLAARGGILFHYNRPYGDIYMEVLEPFRRRGLGSFLVQELKRVCYQDGNIPGARCNPKNLASRQTLQKAGFAPCGHMLVGSLTTPRTAEVL